MVGLIGTFGKVPFICSHDKVFTFSSLKRDKSYRWARHEVIGKKPVYEFLGEDSAQVSFKIRLDMRLGVPPIAGILLLDELSKKGESHALVIGGEFLGRYIIQSVNEDRKFFSGAGVCTIAEVSITLTEVE